MWPTLGRPQRSMMVQCFPLYQMPSDEEHNGLKKDKHTRLQIVCI